MQGQEAALKNAANRRYLRSEEFNDQEFHGSPQAFKVSIKHELRLLDPRQFRDATKVEDRQHRELPTLDQTFQHRRRKPCKPDYAADIAVGDSFLSGEIGDGLSDVKVQGTDTRLHRQIACRFRVFPTCAGIKPRVITCYAPMPNPH